MGVETYKDVLSESLVEDQEISLGNEQQRVYTDNSE